MVYPTYLGYTLLHLVLMHYLYWKQFLIFPIFSAQYSRSSIFRDIFLMNFLSFLLFIIDSFNLPVIYVQCYSYRLVVWDVDLSLELYLYVFLIYPLSEYYIYGFFSNIIKFPDFSTIKINNFINSTKNFFTKKLI